ncbi:hypothetical protein [Listeria kieliensis]|uniref:hypothetical protein n=1 Tax=Listeria kieliensis TaxID=1621700 RepID=UPI0010590E1B|nr:hypothetical protein [Listeria kieliensis]
MSNCLLCGNQVRVPLRFANLFSTTTESWLCTSCRAGFLSAESKQDGNVRAIFKWNEQAENFVERYLNMQDDELSKCFCIEVGKKVRPKLAYLPLSEAGRQILVAAAIPCVMLSEQNQQAEMGVFLMRSAEKVQLAKLSGVHGKIVHVLVLFEEELSCE